MGYQGLIGTMDLVTTFSDTYSVVQCWFMSLTWARKNPATNWSSSGMSLKCTLLGCLLDQLLSLQTRLTLRRVKTNWRSCQPLSVGLAWNLFPFQEGWD